MTTAKTHTTGKAARDGLFAIAVILFQSGCSVFGIRSSAEPEYQLLQQQDHFEIRHYQPYVIATTQVDADFKDAGSQAFRRLFNYISGENRAQQDIAMTAPVMASRSSAGEEMAMTTPVTSERDEQGWRYSFVLPVNYTIQNAPVPTDDRIRLEQVPERRVAVFQYSGSWGNEKFEAHAETLLRWMEQQNLQPESPPRIAAYDPPFAIPFVRRNEILIDIKS